MICCELNQRLLPLVLERETQELKKKSRPRGECGRVVRFHGPAEHPGTRVRRWCVQPEYEDKK